VIGIPMIVGGAAGMLVAPPPTPIWAMAVTSFVVGWVLNLVGHKYFEKNAPAFRDDPLSFLAGPVWDFKNIFSGSLLARIRGAGPTGSTVTPPAAEFRAAPASA
jgi:hypothetical protein